MNVHDSEQMAELLKGSGYETTNDIKKADLIIINTCCIREKAEQKAYSALGRLKKLKLNKPDTIIGVGGCLAQQLGAKFFKKAPYVDMVFGTHNIHRLPEMIEYIETTGSRVLETGFHESVRSLGIPALSLNSRVSAYVTVMQGCNNFCAYCVVPYVRGREESRELKDIINEVTTLADQGVKEVTLLGQNVNSYGKTIRGHPCFSVLLKEVGKIKGIERIRFTTSHPKDLSGDIISLFSQIDELCECIHLPVQSGSDHILKRMRRRYTSRDYLDKVAGLREVCPDISITSDIIVGFPGETEDDFQKTIDLMEKVRFDSLFSFKYSERDGTEAVKFDDKVREDVKKRRLQEVQSLQKKHTLEKNRAMEGKIEYILVEGISKKCPDDIMGRTRSNKIVNFRGRVNLIGKTVPVKITKTYLHSLRGELV
jgi:tRNA-2-methylthio-N6-dimethylallyladenosine synthase